MNAEKVTFKEKLCYGAGDFASVLYWQTFMIYLLYFYTDVFGITAATAGTMFLLSRVLDGITDPIVGMIADRTKSKWGKFRPYLLWFCVPLALAGVLSFTTPNLTDSGKLVWAYITYNLLMLMYTIINIPFNSLLGVLSSSPKQRTSIASIKFLGAYLAGVTISALLLPTVMHLGKGNEARGWQMAFIVIGALAVIFLLIAFAGTKERVKPVATARSSVTRDLRDLMTNKPWLILLGATIPFILFVAIRSTVTVHYFKYYVGTQRFVLPFGIVDKEFGFEILVSIFNTLGQIASIVGVILLPKINNMIGKKKTFILFGLISTICTGLFYLMSPDQITWMLVLQTFGSATGAPLSVLIWAMYADTADYGEWKCGRRATGLIFSASSMCQKWGWAFGSAIAGWLLTLVGFQANMHPSPSVLHGLLLLMSLIPATIGLVFIIFMMPYPLNEAVISQMEADLEDRRKKIKNGGIDGSPSQDLS